MRFIRNLLALAALMLPIAAAAQTPPTYQTPGGTQVLAPPVAVMGVDTTTGSACFAGSSPTCVVRVLSAGGAPSGSTTTDNPTLIGAVDAANIIRALRTALAADQTTGANLLGVGMLCQYVSTFPTYTVGQFATCAASSRGIPYFALANSTGSVIATSSTASDNLVGGVALDVSARNYIWNGSAWLRSLGTAAGASVVGRGGASISPSQVSVGTTATLVAPARVGRQKVIFTVGAANQCAFGPAGVTLTTGFPLQPVAGATLTLETAADVYAVCSATTTVSDMEMFG